MEVIETPSTTVSRRGLLVAGMGAAGVLVSGCADGPDGGGAGTGSAGGYGVPEGGGGGGATGEAGGAGGDQLTSLSEIPIGAAVAVEDPEGNPVIVSRTGEDEVVAFSAVCTHQGCTVRPQGSQIRCPCHGSTFDLTGDNTGGPAPEPLPEVAVRIEGDDVLLA